MASYYRRFIKSFADIATPLHDMTKGSQPEFNWTPLADKSFNELKNRLCTAPILSLPDFQFLSLYIRMPAITDSVPSCRNEEVNMNV